jgi:hypothetical protein
MALPEVWILLRCESGTKVKKRAPAYSKYQQWVDAGRPYWTGVSLANQFTDLPHLRGQLTKGDTPYNRSKLDVYLRDRLALVAAPSPPAPLPGRGEENIAAVAEVLTDGAARSAGDIARFNSIATDQPEMVAEVGPAASDPILPLGGSALKLPDYKDLPPALQHARLENVKKRRRAAELHRLLREDPDAEESVQADRVAELVELMDSVMASYDVEREYLLSGTVPLAEEDLVQQYEKMPLFELVDMITNSLRPMVSRWRKQCTVRAKNGKEDKLVEEAEAGRDARKAKRHPQHYGGKPVVI